MTTAGASTAEDWTRGPLRRLRTAATGSWVDAADLCVVFTVLRALCIAGDGPLPGTLLAHALRRLMACELRPGGPYAVPGVQPDPATNRAIADFLYEYGVVLPGLQAFLDSRAAGPAVPPPDLAAADKRLLSAAAGLIAARPAAGPVPVAADALSVQARVLAAAKRHMDRLAEPLRTTGLAVWDDMRRADRNHEIVLMPLLFADLLADRSGITDDLLILLGQANFFCWIATILYDDFVDEEGDPARLPIANVAQRLSLRLYRQALHDRPGLYVSVERIYDAVDRANAWEVAYARARVTGGSIKLAALPRYGGRMVLADRAFGHAAGPMLLAMWQPHTRQQIAYVRRALRHYLIARQLNDDIHDWRKDLAAGQLSSVVTDMLQAARVGAGRYALDTLTPRLERYFLRHGLTRQCTRLIRHVQSCRQALAASGLTRPTGGFMDLVDDLEASAIAAQRIQANEQAFLQAYQRIAA